MIDLEHCNSTNKSKNTNECGSSSGTRCGLEDTRTIVGVSDWNTHVEFGGSGRLLEGTQLAFAEGTTVTSELHRRHTETAYCSFSGVESSKQNRTELAVVSSDASCGIISCQ